MWKNHAILNYIDWKRSSSRCFFKVIICILELRASCTLFFPLRWIFFYLSNFKGYFINHNDAMKNKGNRTHSRAKDHRTCLPCPLIDYNIMLLEWVRAYLFGYLVNKCRAGCSVQYWGITMTDYLLIPLKQLSVWLIPSIHPIPVGLKCNTKVYGEPYVTTHGI